VKFHPHTHAVELAYQPTPERPYPPELIAPGQWPHFLYHRMTAPVGAVEFRMILNGATKKEWMSYPCPEGMPDFKKFEDIATWQKRGHNAFFGVSLRKVEGVSGDNHVHPTHLIWTDLDMKRTAYLPESADVLELSPEVLRAAAMRLYADVLTVCAAQGLPPLAVVYSGHGLQIYFAREARSSTADTVRMNVALFELFQELGADRTTKNPERILRIPGGFNLKNPERPLQVEVWHIDADARVKDKAIEALMPEPEPRAAAPVTKRTSKAAPAIADKAKARAEKRRRAEVTAAVNGEAENVRTAPDGARNDTLNIAAVKLARFLPHGELEESELIEVLTAAALAAGLEAGETVATIRSGIAFGTQDPADPQRFDEEETQREGQGVKVGRNLAAAVARIEPEAGSTITADEIPDPEGEGGSYSDEQLRELLALPWPVVGIDTDKAHSFRLKDHAGEDLGYVAELGGYVAWNGQQWLHGGKDGAGQVEAKRRVQGLGVYMRPEVDRLLSLYGVLDLAAKRAAQESGADSKRAKQLARKAAAMEKAYYSHGRAARSTESDNKQKAILSSARTLYVKNVQLFEPKPWVVGFRNGTWDRGTFRPAQREDHMLTLAAVEYEPTSDRRDWIDVLERITGGDTELAKTLQDVAGYALSGASSLRLLPWLYGEAGTGKSTFSELLATVLGDMAATIDPKLFAVDAARERLGAAIWGKRVALCAEAGNARLDAEALKTLSGGDRLSVRMLYAEGFTTRASHVLVMVANDAPRVEAYDEALKDRVLALPFNHPLKIGAPLLGGRRVEELRQDPSSKLVCGFTAWAVEGLARVHQLGSIHRAAASQKATRGFWENVDPLHDFWPIHSLSELSVSGVSVSAFRARYESWCQQNSARAFSAQKFNKACLSVGLEQSTIQKERRWLLVKRDKYPSYSDGKTEAQGADQEGEGEGDSQGATGITENDSISQKSNSLLHTRKEEKGFTENRVKPVIPVIPVAPSETPALAPASGEL
jgi:P4 family phage/plasmid primase-like protien